LPVRKEVVIPDHGFWSGEVMMLSIFEVFGQAAEKWKPIGNNRKRRDAKC
jgi:hypothetical protein